MHKTMEIELRHKTVFRNSGSRVKDVHWFHRNIHTILFRLVASYFINKRSLSLLLLFISFPSSFSLFHFKEMHNYENFLGAPIKIMLKKDEAKEEITKNNVEVVMEGIVLPLSNFSFTVCFGMQTLA